MFAEYHTDLVVAAFSHSHLGRDNRRWFFDGFYVSDDDDVSRTKTRAYWEDHGTVSNWCQPGRNDGTLAYWTAV